MGSKLYQFTPSELQQLLDESNGYSDVLRKVGMNPKGNNPQTLKRIIEEYNLDATKMNNNRKELFRKAAYETHKKTIIPISEIIVDNKHPNYSSFKLLKRLIEEKYKQYKCEICGTSEWMGKPLSLQLHHLDGNHTNNLLENLIVLCPNCHSQTDNFSGKNIKKIKLKKNYKEKTIINPPINKKDLKQKIRTMPFTKIGEEYGVSDNAVRKWCKKYNLPYSSRKIKEFSDSQWEKI